MNQVLIVTCDRDRWQFLLQCRSIGKFLEPCKVAIIVNEFKPQSWLQWYKENCEQHLQCHEVTVLQHEDFYHLCNFYLIPNNNGWKSQQVFKMLYAFNTDQDYLVLDSKNWFVKPIQLSEIIPRERRWKDHNYIWDPVVTASTARFGLPEQTLYRPAITPYKFEYKIVKNMIASFGSIDNFLTWFLKFKHPSEFVVYDLYAQSIGAETHPGLGPGVSQNIWHGIVDCVEKQVYSTELDLAALERMIQNENVKIVAVAVILLQDQSLRQQVERLLPLD